MRPHSNENMNVVGHAIYLQHFVFVILEDTPDVFMHSFFPGLMDKRLPVFYGKHKLNVELGVCIWHL